MRLFWAVFFLGSMILIGVDVRERRQSPTAESSFVTADGDPMPIPTPRP